MKRYHDAPLIVAETLAEQDAMMACLGLAADDVWRTGHPGYLEVDVAQNPARRIYQSVCAICRTGPML